MNRCLFAPWFWRQKGHQVRIFLWHLNIPKGIILCEGPRELRGIQICFSNKPTPWLITWIHSQYRLPSSTVALRSEFPTEELGKHLQTVAQSSFLFIYYSKEASFWLKIYVFYLKNQSYIHTEKERQRNRPSTSLLLKGPQQPELGSQELLCCLCGCRGTKPWSVLCFFSPGT